jgi:flavin-dependent dehydrogenase
VIARPAPILRIARCPRTLAVDVRDAAMDGLLLAGDAAGFIDPMTGDGTL